MFCLLLGIGVGFASGILTFVLGMLASMTNMDIFATLAGLISIVASLGSGIYAFYVTFPIQVRRLHDTGKSGLTILWCALGNLVCGIGGIVLFVFMVLNSTPVENQYGPNPKDTDNDTADKRIKRPQ